MGCDQIWKYVIRTTRMCYRSVCSHPLTMGILLLLLFLYRSSPYLFSLFVSASPVLVCTAILLGVLLSFGEPNVLPATEKTSYEFGLSKTIRFEGTLVGENELPSLSSIYTDFKRDLVTGGGDEPLADTADELHKCEKLHDGHVDHYSREVIFENQSVEEVKSDLESTKIEQLLNSGDQLFRMGVDIGLSNSPEKLQNEQKEEDKSVDGSVDTQMGNHLATYLESQKHEDFEHYKSAEGSLDVQIGDQLEHSLASWQQLDGFDGALFPSQELQNKRFEDFKLGEGSSEAQLRDYFESSLRSWKPVSSDHDEDDESDYGSNGAESSSPDASMADIIPMLDELHPLLDDEIPQACNLSRHSSIGTVEGSVKSPESCSHSEDESDHKEDEAADGKSDVDDENEEETQAQKDDYVTSAIMWTEDDQKNLMDLGTSELERNHRLESLIARRRARKLMANNNLIDFDGMDLPFPVAPIATRLHNPFDYPHESYDDLGLPPVPGSAPPIMLNRRNPFDLPYDSSEEKPDLTGDSFQQEFSKITQRDVINQREAMFRRNETFSVGSSAFDFARPSRFRPFFVHERTDSDGMSYSSLQSLRRQFSELSESKESSIAETESTSVASYQEEKKQIEHDFAQEAELSSEIDQDSLLVQHRSHSSEAVESLSCEEKEEIDFVLYVRNLELGRESSSPAGTAYTPEMGSSAVNRLPHEDLSCAKESWLSRSERSHSDILMAEFIDAKHNTTSGSLPVPKVNENKLEDVDSCLVDMEPNRVNDGMTMKCLLESVVSDATTEQALDASDFIHALEVENKHQKEPIYDWSPLKNHSLSSSDLQRETSGIDLYHLSSESFVVDVSYAHNDIARNNSRLAGQDPDGNSLTKRGMDEGNMLDRAELFSELKQLPDNSLAVAEGEGHLNLESLDRELNDVINGSKVSSNEAERIFEPTDDAETHVESRLDDNRRVDDMPSCDGREFVEDLISTQEKNELVLLADNRFPVKSMLSCSQVKSNIEVGMEMEANQQQIQVSSSSLVSHKGDEDKLFSSLDENNFFLHQSDMHDPFADLAKQESSIIHMKLEQADQLNKVIETVNLLAFQEPVHDKTFACQSNRTSSHHEEKAIAELVAEDHLQDAPETRHAYIVDENHEISEGFKNDEPTLYERKNGIKGMDEALLSELDSVGDFRVLDVVPSTANSMAYSTAAVGFSIPAGFIGKVHSNTEMPFVQKTYLADTALVGKSKSDTGISGATVSDTMEPNLDSHIENVTTNLLVLEAQFVNKIDAGLMKVREGTQKSVVVEPFSAEFKGKEEIAFPETELLLAEAEGGCASGVRNTTADAAFCSSALISGTTQREHYLLETNSLHCDRRETGPQNLLLDAQIMEQSCEYAEQVVDGVDTVSVEAQKTAALIGVGSIEFAPSLIEREIKKTEKTSITESIYTPVPEPKDQTDNAVSQVDRDLKQIDFKQIAESSNAPALDPRDQAGFGSMEFDQAGVGSMEFESSQIDGETEEIGKTPSAAPVLVSEDQTEGTGSMEFESSQIDGHTKKMEIEARAAPTLQSRDQAEASSINEDNKEIGKLSLVESSSAAPDLQPRYLSKGVSFMELKSSHTDGDTEEMNSKTPVEASAEPALQLIDQADGVGTMELESFQVDRDINEIQESSLLEASNSLAVGSEIGSETLEMPVVVARVAPTIEPENHRERIISEPLLLGKESQSVQESILDGTNIISTLKSDSLQTDRAVTDTLEFAAGEEIIAVAPESENQKGIVGSSEALQFDINIPKVQVSPAVEAGIPSAHEPEEEKEYVGYPEFLQLQVNRGIEESILVMLSEDQTARTAPLEYESWQILTDTAAIQRFPTSQASIAAASVLEDQTTKVNHEDSGPLLVGRSLGELKELPAVEARDAPVLETCYASAFESEGQLERVVSVELQQLQVDVDSKGIQGCTILETSYASDFRSVYEMANNLQSDVGVQASQDQQLVSELQPEVDASVASDSRGNHV